MIINQNTNTHIYESEKGNVIIFSFYDSSCDEKMCKKITKALSDRNYVFVFVLDNNEEEKTQRLVDEYISFYPNVESYVVVDKEKIKADYGYAGFVLGIENCGEKDAYIFDGDNYRTKKQNLKNIVIKSYATKDNKLIPTFLDYNKIKEQIDEALNNGITDLKLCKSEFSSSKDNKIKSIEITGQILKDYSQITTLEPAKMDIDKTSVETLIALMKNDERLIKYIHFTADYFSDRLLMIAKKEYGIKEIKEVFNICKESGVLFGTRIWCGNPNETEEDKKIEIDFIKASDISYVDATPYHYLLKEGKCEKEYWEKMQEKEQIEDVICDKWAKLEEINTTDKGLFAAYNILIPLYDKLNEEND